MREDAFYHFHLGFFGKLDNTLAGNAVQEAIRDWRMDLAALREENIRAGAFCHATLPIEHHRIGIAFTLGAMF